MIGYAGDPTFYNIYHVTQPNYEPNPYLEIVAKFCVFDESVYTAALSYIDWFVIT
jgi:hypothetical protein